MVDKYKLRPYIHLKHELTHAKWDESTSKWTVRIRRLREDGSTDEFEEPCDVLMLCIGGLNRWQWPNIDGLKAFKGTILHTAQWNQTDGAYENWGNKNVGVVGNVRAGTCDAQWDRLNKCTPLGIIRASSSISYTSEGQDAYKLRATEDLDCSRPCDRRG